MLAQANRLFFALYTVYKQKIRASKKKSSSTVNALFTNWFLHTWWNCLKLGTNVQEDRPIKMVSQVYLLAPNVYFTDRKVVNMAIFRS